MKQWYVYEDWTLEPDSRCFYVGKGDDDRVIKLKRSVDHDAVVEQFGHKRIISLTTTNESAALDFERILIKERHTYIHDSEYNGIGCNKTFGGQGTSGRIVSDETCKKISEAKKGKHPRKIWTQAERNATSARMSILHKGKKLSAEHRGILKARMANAVIKNDMKKKVSQALNDKYANDLTFVENIRRTRVRGEQSNSPFTEDEVKQMRIEWDLIDKTIKGDKWSGMSPARLFCQKWANAKNVSNQAIYAIVTRRTWKHVQ